MAQWWSLVRRHSSFAYLLRMYSGDHHHSADFHSLIWPVAAGIGRTPPVLQTLVYLKCFPTGRPGLYQSCLVL